MMLEPRVPYRAVTLLGQPALEPVARGVWVMRGGASPTSMLLSAVNGHLLRRIMNVFLIEEDDGVTVFDAGIERMAGTLGDVADRMGGLKRVVLGHAHGDHRGAAPRLGAPVYCHPDAVTEAESAEEPPYSDYSKIEDPAARRVLPLLMKQWDGGPVSVAGTVSEGDEVGDFRVVELAGHAPGLIGLWRESDRLALVSDTIYMVDFKMNPIDPIVPHPFYSMDRERARESVRKLAALEPREVWPGHLGPLTGDVRRRLEHAAEHT